MNFDLASTPIHKGVNRLEASAGTGKTYALAGLFVRLLIEEKVSAREILVVTFTEAATAELRDRIRRRVSEALAELEGGAAADLPVESPGDARERRESADVLRLRNALEVFDLVSIYTIHGFCQRTLQDSAFESGILFDVELAPNQEDLIRDVAADYCRNQLHARDALMAGAALRGGIDPDTLSKVLRQYLTHPELELVTAAPVDDVNELVQRIQSDFEACASAWSKAGGGRALVDYFTQGKKWSVKDHAREEVVRLHAGYLQGCQDIERLSSGFWDAVDFFSLSAVIEETGSNKQMPADPDCRRLFEICERLKSLASDYSTSHRLAFLRSAREMLEKRKQEAKQQSYDDLITRLAGALDGPSGDALAAGIRRRYKAALIDESQDTDPLQWRIFERVFARSKEHWLYLIGDPKQAIYGFRGADVKTYLRAAATAEHEFSLGTNWRSESALVHGVNALFAERGAGEAFVEKQIGFEPVAPGPKADSEPIRFAEIGRPAPFHVWYWEPEGGTVTAAGAQRQLPVSVAAEISRLLSATVVVGKRRLRPRDIAVLVESHRQARWIQQALHELKIPSVEQAMESVFESGEAREMEWILSAVLAPGREAAVRAALTTDALGQSATALKSLLGDEAGWQGRLQKFARYRAEWEAEGFFAMFVRLLREEQVIEHLLRFANAERRITNLMHVAELLEAACKAEHLGPARLVQWLQQRRRDDSAAPDEFQLRLESDEDAVQIVTIHRSKGLQYPVVFCPFVSKDASLRQIRENGRKVMDLVLYHRENDGKLSWDVSTEPDADHARLAAREQLAEKVRLLYVALTRACNRCYLVSARYGKARSTALAWLMHRPAAAAQEEDPVTALDVANPGAGEWREIWQEIASVAQQSNGGQPAIAIEDLPVEKGTDWVREGVATPELRSRVCAREVKPSWYLSSFTGLSARLELHRAEGDADGADRDETVLMAGASAGPEEAHKEATGIFALPAGARTGDCLHKILERYEFVNPDAEETRALVREQLEGAGIWSEERASAVAGMLERVRRVPLDPARPEFTLERVPSAQRLAEMEFHFPAGALDAKRLVEVIRSKAGADISRPSGSKEIAAFLKGFIDLVFLYEGRYHIVDWKSNLIGSRPEEYTLAAMKEEIEANCYDLQYHLYTLALHKFLGRRLVDYKYENHFGGVHYLFLRGIDPMHPERGVFHARPARETVRRLSELLGRFEEVGV